LRKSRGTRAQQLGVDLIALEVHRRDVVAFGAYPNDRRFSYVFDDLRGLALGKLGAVGIDAERRDRPRA